MEKIQRLLKKLKSKSIKIYLGAHTVRVRLLTFCIFGLSIAVLLLAIIIMIIVNACSSSDVTAGEETAFASAAPSDVSAEVDLTPAPEDPEEIEIEDPNLPSDDIEPDPTPEATAAPTEPVETPGTDTSAFTTIKSGDTAEIVKTIQQRLVDLYYMDYPVQTNGSYSVTSKFGSTTSKALQIFQERNGLTSTGDCDEATYNALISSNAVSYIMKQNDKWDMVKTIQTKLKEKGFLDKVTGYCGSDTITAVQNFQKASGLTADGIAGSGTLKLLLGH